MRWEDFRPSTNVEDRRGMGIPGGRGGLGMGTIIILGLVGWALGIDPRVLIGGAEMMTGGGGGYEQSQRGQTGTPQHEGGRFAAAIARESANAPSREGAFAQLLVALDYGVLLVVELVVEVVATASSGSLMSSVKLASL